MTRRQKGSGIFMAERMQAAQRRLREGGAESVLIVGGGINGIATLRELALQGINAVLVERNDYCSGASAASSHMIHGGIRYLENGEFRLVQESVRERNRLLRLAPHRVRPLETVVPLFSTWSGLISAPLRLIRHRRSGRPAERGALLVKVGLILYDLYSRDGGRVPRHKFHGRRKSLEAMPRLNPDVKYTAAYFDASIADPERLALELLVDALATGNAESLNYTEVIGENEDGILLRDRTTGEEAAVRPGLVVNATGPWTDMTNAALGRPTHWMGGTKGSHIVVDNPDLLEACGGREVFFEHADGRIVLIYPLAGRVLIGTSDIHARGELDTVISEEEIVYFLDLVHHVFPDIEVRRDQIVHTFSGVRPLPSEGDAAPGFISRDYRIERDRSPRGTRLVSLVGGKWTTFRAVSEHLADTVLTEVGVQRTVSTTDLPIGGGKGYPALREQDRWLAEHSQGLPIATMRTLFERYGTRAAEAAAVIAQDDQALAILEDYSRGEIRWIATAESVVRLADVVLRRTSIAFTGRASQEALEELAEVVGGALGWDDERRAEEVRRTFDELASRHPSRSTDALTESTDAKVSSSTASS
ncbi:glycerol-3-phosphate dehydrogenase/oxidase [Ruicaihuangia caeni]|uniref:glycerol-3-phosphate dehydrogenase/oxidase n=1 Tax=Ruicaihuangia caeni TaxID=3042517 RepID=UPI00338D4F35